MKKIKISKNIIIMLVLSTLLLYVCEKPDIIPIPCENIDCKIDSIMEIAHFPGLSSGIIKDGEIKWTGNYGLADVEDNIYVEVNTVFAVASISKSIVAIRLMQLWEQGLFELDDPINDYLPFVVNIPSDTLTPITFRMLCSHVSSIKDRWNTGLPIYIYNTDPTEPLGDLMYDYLCEDGEMYSPENFYSVSPGDEWNYCNINYALLAYLIEIIGNNPFSNQTEQYIFEPLNMDNTGWFIADFDESNMAKSYKWSGVYTTDGYVTVSPYPPAALRTNVNDLSVLLKCYMNKGSYSGTQILNSSTVDSMLNVQYPEFDQWPQLDGDMFGGIGFWHLDTGQKTVWASGGGMEGTSSWLEFDPEEDIGIIVLINRRDDDKMGKIVDILYEYALDSIP